MSPEGTQSSERVLREQVRYLGQRLGETLRESGAPWLFELVERVRKLAKASRAGVSGAADQLRAVLAELGAEQAGPLARAFAHFNALANIAEARQRARAWEVAATSTGSLTSVLIAQRDAGIAPDQLHAAVAGLAIELVLTAHPTQATRRTMLTKHARIAVALARRERAAGRTADHLDEAIRREIAAAWHTDDVRQQRPTPVDEARSGLAVFEQILWQAVPAFLRDLDDALVASTGRGLGPDHLPIRFGTWIGGDRDGNPNVTPAVTEEVCLLARWQAAELYLAELDALHDELSVVVADDDVRGLAASAHEPYRKICRQLCRRLTATMRWCERALDAVQAGAPPPVHDPELVLDVADLARPLATMQRSLERNGLGIVATGRLLDLQRRVATFGTTLARLDIRQHAGVHTAALDAITRALDAGSYAAWDEAARRAFLLAELASKRPLLPRQLPDDEALRDVMSTLATCARQGPGSLGAYVISMAAEPSDVLAMYLLQREAGVDPAMRVVPLFETLKDLEAAPRVIDELLALPAARAVIGDRLEVMIGYSDSAKDAGRVASAWGLFQAQEELLAVAARHGVTLTLFHGRGGTIARGGGPIALAIRSQPAGSVAGGLRVTVQGEAIDVAFGLPETARQTLELYVGASLDSVLAPPAPPRPSWRERMDDLARRSAASYRAVLETPGFVELFEAATPEVELGVLHIGSRPARRRSAGHDLSGLRAIPWSFAWTQNRLILPSWLGAQVALDDVTPAAAAELHEMFAAWPYFTALVDLLEMALAKADPSVVALYSAALAPVHLQPLGEELRRQCERARAAVLFIRDEDDLLSDNDLLRWSIAVRHPYIDPLNLLQIELLRRVRAGDDDPQLVAALAYTIAGIAAGMRNTG